MNYKGLCFWAGNIPTPEAPHYIIIITEPNEKGEALAVVVSSIKYFDDGKAKYYDPACVLNVGDIKNEQGKNLIIKKSFIRYEYTTVIDVNKIITNQFKSIFKYKCVISSELLKRIQDGAKISKELALRFKQYFTWF